MKLLMRKHLQVYSGRSNVGLAREIASRLAVPLGEANLVDFASGEIGCRFESSVRGADVFIVQTHSRPVNDSIMEQLLMVDAAKRASARRITAVCPLYGYSRQDRKATGRDPISAKLVADLFAAAGVDRIVAVDLHTGQIQGFFDGPVDHLTAMPVFVEYLRGEVDGECAVVAPDAGRVRTAQRYAEHLDAHVAFVHKRRIPGKVNVVQAKTLVGEVAGRTCVLVDDMIDTGGTLCAAAELLRDRGASSILAVATHGILSDPALARLEASPLRKVVVTDTVAVAEAQRTPKLEILPIAPIIARAIRAIFEDASVSEIFLGENVA